MSTGIHSVRARLKLSLPPAKTRDIVAGVREYLNTMLLRHNKMFDGILLGYSDERILEHAAPVSPYFTYVNVTVEVMLSVFRPVKGLVLPGMVNKVGSDFIALLVFGTINCAIPRSLIRREFQPRELEQSWVSKTDASHVIKAGSALQFEVDELVLGEGHCSLVGSLGAPHTGLMGKVPAPPAPQPQPKKTKQQQQPAAGAKRKAEDREDGKRDAEPEAKKKSKKDKEKKEKDGEGKKDKGKDKDKGKKDGKKKKD